MAYGKPPLEVGNILYNKGTKYLLAGKYDKALATLKKEPYNTKEKFLNMGNAARGLGKFDLALTYYDKCLDEDLLDMHGEGGLYAPALCNIGLLLYGDGQDEEAIRFYKAALEKNPLTYDAIWNCSTALLRQWCSGSELNKDAWGMYEYRFKVLGGLTDKYKPWKGERVGTLLILAEQGLGDKLMWGRYFTEAAKHCDKLILQLPKVLWPLFPDYECVEDLEKVTADAAFPLAKLAQQFGIIEGEYLTKYLVKRSDDKIKIAVEWAGSKTHKNNGYRSCYPVYFSELAKKYSNVEFYNFRPDAPEIPGVKKVLCKNFEETALGLGDMDLLISVDTSIVHLAGSMGLETWLLQPIRETDFRWGLAESKIKYGINVESNIWYPSVRVIDNSNWDKTFARIDKRLNKFISGEIPRLKEAV